ncbi:MAG TPA: hypothetical protein VFE53_01420 [Mucilaginibacter sp.]|jgi:hypothetical protein|nr:hypothetical protein [Mucilaginibacter sp.]
MANYCSNNVLFLGDPKTVDAIKEVFADIEHEQKRTHLYYLPDFVKDDKGYMLDISFDDQWITYESRWTPNLPLLIQFADHFKVEFISHFDEMVNGVYGEAVYHNGELKTIYRDAYEEENLAEDTELAGFRQEQKLMLEEAAKRDYNLNQR